VPRGTVGEIIVRGPNVMMGYWNQPELTAAALRDGWMHTGDGGRMDEDGFVYFKLRLKRMIKSSGMNVYPAQVEDVLYQHDEVLECCVIGVPDEVQVERVKAFVVLKPGEQMSEQEVIDYCREKLARYKLPTQVEFIQSLPKSGVGKILRKELRAMELARKNK